MAAQPGPASQQGLATPPTAPPAQAGSAAAAPSTTGASRERLLSSLAGNRPPPGAAAPDVAGARQPSGGWPAAGAAASPLGITMQPLEETYFTVTDRRVRKVAEPGSLYRMCRQWVQNEPDIDPEPLPAPGAPPALPEPLPAGTSAERAPPEEVPLFDDGTLFQDEETLPIELLLEHHKEHWVTVRRHWKAERERDLERFEHRLAALVPSLPSLQPMDGPAAGIAPLEL